MKCLLIFLLISCTGAVIHKLNNVDKPLKLQGKVALVTGSNSGIGEAVVKLLATLGAQVVVTGRNATTVHQVAREVRRLSPCKIKPLEFPADLTKDIEAKKLVIATIKRFGRLDILVNSAGAGFVANIEDPNFVTALDRSYRLNVRATALLNHLSVPYLKQTNGTIVHISSIASTVPTALWMAYNMAKSAMDMMTKCMAVELGPQGIRVNSVNPGFIKTNFYANTGVPDTVINETAKVTPLRRAGQVWDVAKGVAFLASSDAAFITGANLVIDGGAVYTVGGLFA